jgi:mono/diheme cytochrome c family protein
MFAYRLMIGCVLIGLSLVFGCSPAPSAFSSNRLLTARVAADVEHDCLDLEEQVQAALTDSFGTPDRPLIPASLTADPSSAIRSLIDLSALKRAAGPFGRGYDKVEVGLYRKHCAGCHGISGDGFGPAAALLAPYPRDFRRGSFKYKATVLGDRPSLEDLRRVIERGVPGTSMPGLAMHAAVERDKADSNQEAYVLAHYVRYLAIRGEVERRLMLELGSEVDWEGGGSLYRPEWQARDPAAFQSQQRAIDAVVREVAARWASPRKFEVVVEEGLLFKGGALPETEQQRFLASARRGMTLFRGDQAACYQCHGVDGDGVGKLQDFDEWTKDWTIRAGIDPKLPAQWRPLRALGLLKPVVVPARNLQLGVMRGGSDPEDVYRVIARGMDGTPMPAAPRLPEVKNGLTNPQVWDLVNYCFALSQPELRRQLHAKEAVHDGS